jgi:hypothetical protein
MPENKTTVPENPMGKGGDALDNLFTADVSRFDEQTGELNLDDWFKSQPLDEDKAPEVDEKLLDQTEPNSNNLNSVASPIDAKIAQLEGTIEKLATVVIALSNGRQSNNPELPPQEEPDFSDSRQLASFIKQTVMEAVTAATKGVTESSQEMRLRMDYSTTLAKYGDAFTQLLPQVGKLMQTDPEKWTFDTAFQFIKSLSPGSSNAITATKPAINVAELTKKADALVSEADKGKSGMPAPKLNGKVSLESALNAALVSLGS